MSFKQKYGKTALVAGASEGIGAAFSKHLAKQGLNLVLVARRVEPLVDLAKEIQEQYKVEVQTVSCDLSKIDAAQTLIDTVKNLDIDIFIYNAGLSYIGAFEKNDPKHHEQIAITNILTPLSLVQSFGTRMLARKKGAIVLMGSLAGMQGAGHLSTYAASKAFDTILAESLWYEWKDKGVDVIACVPGATSSPNFLNTKPKKAGWIEPKVQTPEEVVEECFAKLGKQPRIITGFANRLANFFMHRILSRKIAVKIMGDTTRKMYGV
jgi:short-subunit dehydrogenase